MPRAPLTVSLCTCSRAITVFYRLSVLCHRHAVLTRGRVRRAWYVTQEIAEGIADIAELKLIGKSEAMVVCFGGDSEVNIYKVVSV